VHTFNNEDSVVPERKMGLIWCTGTILAASLSGC